MSRGRAPLKFKSNEMLASILEWWRACLPDHDQLRNMDPVLKRVLPVLLTFVAVKFQGSSKSPFETHPITVFFSIFALLLYFVLSRQLATRPSDLTTAYSTLVFPLLMILSFSLSITLPTLLLFSGPSFWLLLLPLLILLSPAPFCRLVQKLRLDQQWIPPSFLHGLFEGRGRARILPLTKNDTRVVNGSDRVLPSSSTMPSLARGSHPILSRNSTMPSLA